uniref:acyl carrier protein n=1 Tax=Paenibacillus maysiensis TaxID=1155954 RepID=UPI001ADF3AD2
ASSNRSGRSNRSVRTNGIALQPLSAVREPSSERSAPRRPIQLSPVGQATTASAPVEIKVAVPAPSVPASIPAESLQKELQATLAEALFLQPSDVDVNKAFVDMGLDSIVGVEWVRVINQQYGTDIPATKVYDYPTIREFAGYIANVLSKNAPRAATAPVPAPTPAPQIEAPKAAPSVSEATLHEELRASLADALFLQAADIDLDKKFVDMGLDSIVGVEWIRVINQQYGTDIPATKVYDYPTVRELATYLSKSLKVQPSEPSQPEIKTASPIPSAPSAEALQEELRTSLADALFLQPSDIDLDRKFVDMGLDSIVGVEWIRVINQQHGTDIPATKVYDYPTLRELAAYLSKQLHKHPIAEQPAMELSVDDLLLQVYEGNLDSEQADQLFQQFKIKEEVK